MSGIVKCFFVFSFWLFSFVTLIPLSVRLTSFPSYLCPRNKFRRVFFHVDVDVLLCRCVAFKFHQTKNGKHFDHIGNYWIDWNWNKIEEEICKAAKWQSTIQSATNKRMNEWMKKSHSVYVVAAVAAAVALLYWIGYCGMYRIEIIKRSAWIEP